MTCTGSWHWWNRAVVGAAADTAVAVVVAAAAVAAGSDAGAEQEGRLAVRRLVQEPMVV